jgi:hypothetical protein
MFKYGVGDLDATTDDLSIADNHDVLAAQWIKTHTELPTAVADAVEAYAGPWYQGPEPTTELQRLVHDADMAASTPNGTWGVYQPAEKLADKYPIIPRANL